MKAEICCAVYFVPSMSTVQSVPMCRLTEETVRSTFVTACRLATSPTRTSPFLEKPTTEGVVRAPSALAMTVGSPPSRTETQEFVVPRSMPTARAIECFSFSLLQVALLGATSSSLAVGSYIRSAPLFLSPTSSTLDGVALFPRLSPSRVTSFTSRGRLPYARHPVDPGAFEELPRRNAGSTRAKGWAGGRRARTMPKRVSACRHRFTQHSKEKSCLAK